MSINATPPRGMRDILPTEMRLRNAAFRAIVNTYEKYGFTQIETPALEHLDILSKDSDSENAKLVFSILKRGDKIEKAMQENDVTALSDLGLRYDLTVPLARYYACNRENLPSVFKSIQIGPVWRAERPQKGRYRQFYQCDIDILGYNSIYSELELISASSEALLSLGLKNFVIRVNDRRILTTIIQYCGFSEEYTPSILIILDKLDKVGSDGVRDELIQKKLDVSKINALLDLIHLLSSSDKSQSLLKLKQTLKQHLDASVVEELDFLINQINEQSHGSFSCVFDFTLVRGMGYYTGPIFEINYKDYPFSIAGGGRYDNMINQITGRGDVIPACGISLGFERIVVILNDENLLSLSKLDVIALIVDGGADPKTVMQIVKNLRDSKQNVSIYKRGKNFTKQLNDLYQNGIKLYKTIDRDSRLSDKSEISLKTANKTVLSTS